MITPEKSVFISYSTEDRARALSIVADLEEVGVSCWIAPRNIGPGEKYAEAIMRGLEECDTFLLTFSRHSNESQYVQREVERAISLNKRVVPVRIENILPSASMDFFLATLQWIDAHGVEGNQPIIDFLKPGAKIREREPLPTLPERKGRGKIISIAAVGLLLFAAVFHLLNKTDDPPTVSNTPDTPAWLAMLDEPTRKQLEALPHDFKLELSVPGSSSPSFRLGEPIQFILRSSEDAHVVVLVQSSDRSEVVVFPNTKNRETFVTAGDAVTLPGDGMKLTAGAPTGTDVVFALASTEKSDIESFVNGLQSGSSAFPFASFASSRTRGVILGSDASHPAIAAARSSTDPSKVKRSFAGLSFVIKK